jgi:hypothetical protein
VICLSSLIFCFSENISLPASPKSLLYPWRPTPLEGRIAIVTDAGRDVVDAAASGAQVVAGRDEPRERLRRARRTASVADGQVVWFWHPLLVSSSRRQAGPDRVRQNLNPRNDGDKQELVAGKSTK